LISSCPFLLELKVKVLLRIFICLFLFPLVLTSCTHGLYLGKLAWGETQILAGQVPNQVVLRDEGVEEEIKEKIRLVQEVTEFSQNTLGLRPDSCYETFYPVKGDALVYLVSACPKDSLEPFTWRFPIVGELEYKGFFSKRDAVKEIKKLEEKELDTCLQHAIAFSTLGWLSDPIYSTVLDQHPAIVINIIVHELVHNTVFFKGETAFNEGVASFIADRGTLLFIEERFGASSPLYQLAVDLARDEEVVAGFFQELYDALEGLYAQDLAREEKLRQREEVFAHGHGQLAELNKELKTGNFSGPTRRLNNAVVLAHRRYRIPPHGLLKQAYEALGGDVKSLVELLRIIKNSKEPPYRFLERWLQEGVSPPPG
jgi:predicted aminopeptidase